MDEQHQEQKPQLLSTSQKPTDAEMLIQLIHPLIPAVQEYLAGQRKDKETDQMSIEFDYQVRLKELDHLREEQKEARVERSEERKDYRGERRELRIGALIASVLVGGILVAAVLKDQNAMALEIIKLLAGILGPAFGAYWYGKAKQQQQKPVSKPTKTDADDDNEEEE